MRKAIPALVLAVLVSSLPAMAARGTVVPVVHETNIVYQAYSFPSPVTTVGIPPILAVSGVLSFSPMALVQSAVGQRRITIKSVVLQKQTPQVIQCADVFPAHTVSQQGATNVRLTWPLMYEVPGTTWTLTIV